MIKRYIYVFGGLQYFRAFQEVADKKNFTLVHIFDESEDMPNYAKSSEALIELFESIYDNSQDVAAFVSLGRGTVIDGIENIAKAWELIKERHPELQSSKFVGPSCEAAKIFFDKKLIWETFEQLGVEHPQTIALDPLLTENELFANLKDIHFPFPAILKATRLSGGRGMKLISSEDDFVPAVRELKQMGIEDFILTEYIQGTEVSFAVLRLGDTFMRMPACFKEDTSLGLKHPDSRVKLTGEFKEFEQAYAAVENIMKELDITGWLYLEGILQKDDKGTHTIAFIEGATRLSGNSAIEVGALEGFSFYETLLQWIEDDSLGFAYRNRLCVQHASFKHNGPKDVKKLLAKDWVLDARYEDLADMPFSTDTRTRIRVSYIGDDFHTAQQRANEIARILGDDSFAENIKEVLDKYASSDLLYEPYELSSGTWNYDLSWKFFMTSYLPRPELCTAVFCLALNKDNTIVLTKTKRGWEMLGGHIEAGETIVDALFREAHEEGGYTPRRYKLFGYREITSSQPIFAPDGRKYPFPKSFIPHFIAKSDLPLEEAHGDTDEIIGNDSIALSKIQELNFKEITIVEAGLQLRDTL